jgi:ubiquinone biosynthesis protein Coq4
MGELGVQGFLVAQLLWPTAGMIIGLAVLGTVMKQAEQADVVLGQVVHGYALGRMSAPLIAQDWDALWAQPLEVVRTKLGLPIDPSTTTAPPLSNAVRAGVSAAVG